jgi:6-phosphogluconolactonase
MAEQIVHFDRPGIASLFPNDLQGVDSPVAYRAVVGPKPPPDRITPGYAPLVRAREVWLLASGAGKADALKRSLTGERDTPLGRLLRMRGRTRVLTDIPLPQGTN